jgi:hypothetical protein
MVQSRTVFTWHENAAAVPSIEGKGMQTNRTGVITDGKLANNNKIVGAIAGQHLA